MIAVLIPVGVASFLFSLGTLVGAVLGAAGRAGRSFEPSSGWIEPGSNRARLLNVLWMADEATRRGTEEALDHLTLALEALPPGWEELVTAEVPE